MPRISNNKHSDTQEQMKFYRTFLVSRAVQAVIVVFYIMTPCKLLCFRHFCVDFKKTLISPKYGAPSRTRPQYGAPSRTRPQHGNIHGTLQLQLRRQCVDIRLNTCTVSDALSIPSHVWQHECPYRNSITSHHGVLVTVTHNASNVST